ncbi:regulatory protein RecX [Bifidobacterium goeldii]|nr:regulatory protein RecX [Bifidobacterium goeldii]
MIRAEDFLADHAPLVGDDSATDAVITNQQRSFPARQSSAGSAAWHRRSRQQRTNARYASRSQSIGMSGVQSDSAQGKGVEDPRDYDACREAALRLLDAAARPSGALRDRLIAKGYDEDIVADVIDRLTQLSLLDDEAYAQSALRYCLNRLMGQRGAMADLTRKGVGRQLAMRVCEQAREQGAFEDAAWELGRQSARKTVGLDQQTRKRRFWSAGGRKGHNPATLGEVAHALFDQSSND